MGYPRDYTATMAEQNKRAGQLMKDDLSPAEAELFSDNAIKAAYSAWASDPSNARNNVSRKQFLLRLRFLFQAGKLPA